MTESRSRRLLRLPRALRRRLLGVRRAREEGALQPRLRHDPAAPQLILSPHWDDAALDCWGVLCGEGEVNVVNLFAGVPAPGTRGTWEAILGVADTAERARMRIAEDAAALAGAGRTAVNIPLLDAHFRPRHGAPSLRELDRLLAQAVPAASRVYAPAGIGGHADHVLARRYGRLLARAGMPVALYAELPYCIFHGWPAWVDEGARDEDRDVDAYWRSYLRGVPELPPLRDARVQRLSERQAAAKLRAIGLYRASLNHGARQLLSAPAFHGIEVRWELRAPDGA